MIRTNVSLKEFSNFKIGGPAAYFLEVNSVDQLKEGLVEWRKMTQTINRKPFILGGGTNVLISDSGYDGLIIHNYISGSQLNGIELRAGSGVLVSDILNFCVEHSFSGLEWAGGLPGTIGAAARGNAGAFGGEIKDNLVRLKSLSSETLDEKIRENRECFFGYRQSYFKSEEGKKEIITEVTLSLIKGDKQAIQNKINECIECRQKKHPLEFPNIGSVFKNVNFEKIPDKFKEEMRPFIKTDSIPVISAARLINLCGLKGKQIGGAMFSEKHPNFIVNVGNALAADVVQLISLAKKEVNHKFKVKLEEEITYLGKF